MTLPDLDTSNISFIGYWNFLDNGGSSIDPIEATSAMDTYDEYSNGVQGVMSDDPFTNQNGREMGCRVKDDGWMLVWLDRTKVEDTQVGWGNKDLHGPWDILTDWTIENNDVTIGTTLLSENISALHQALSNTAEATFNHSDVGHWNYETGGGTTISHHNIHHSGGTFDGYLNPASDDTIYGGWVAASESLNAGEEGVVWAYSQESVTVAQGNNTFGSREVASRGEIQAGETVQFRVDGGGKGQGSVVILWG